MTTSVQHARSRSGTPATAGAPVRVRIPCFRAPNDPGDNSHDILLYADWTIGTPHDLEAERIATALGGYCDCLTLADTAIPAAQEWLGLHLRERSPDIWFSADHGWRITSSPSTEIEAKRRRPDEPECQCPARFRWVDEAVAHATSIDHLAGRHGAQLRHAIPLADALAAHWRAFTDHILIDPELSRRTHIPAAARALWLAGIHPAWGWHHLDQIRQVRTGVPLAYFIGMVYAQPYLNRPRELAQQRDGASASWLVWSRDCPEPRHPLAYAGWLGLPSISPDRARTLLAAGRDSTQADQLAAALGTTVDDAAGLLYGWARLRCRPSIDDLLALGPSIDPPPRDLLDAVHDSDHLARTTATRTEVGLLLALTRTPDPVIASVQDGVRSITDFTRWINDRRDH